MPPRRDSICSTFCRSSRRSCCWGSGGGFRFRTAERSCPSASEFSILGAMAQDLRSFLDLVKRRKPGDFEIVSRPVDPRYELTALVVKLEREAKRRPVLLFENVKGTKFPVLTNLHASRARLAAAMNAAPEAMLPAYLRAMERPLAPRVVATGPVKEV